MTQHGFFVDLSRCIGCNSCTVSCKQWHDIAPGPAKPMRVYQWETGSFPNIRLSMLPIMCYHCAIPVCKEACPNNAIYKEERYGAVLVDHDKCRGTRKCWEACPYGTPQYHSDDPDDKVLKCDMCIERLEERLKPICVLSCSMRALEFGPMDELIRKYGNFNRLEARPEYAPCRLVCPAEINAEGYIKLISEGKAKEAIEVLREATPFAGVLGRVCTHPCEADCQRGQVDQAVSIQLLKRHMADDELKRGRAKATPVEKTKRDQVAIVGSGPAGLSCAYDLVRKGYAVTIFEAAAESGGMLRYGIPEYRLPKDVLDNEISYIQELGVEIKSNIRVANSDDVFNQGYKAIFLAIGAWVSQKLGVEGEDANGVIYALDFLQRVNCGTGVELGKKIVVIGGGSVAIDAARAALRLGASEVQLICLESRDLSCRDRMLAQDLEIEEAEEEGVIIRDCLGVSRILTGKDRVIGLEMINCLSVLDDRGQFAPRFSDGPAPVIEADTVIIAIGQKPDTSAFPELERVSSGIVKVDALTLETNVRGVFAGADMVTGQADVISAVAAGKQAAVSIERYLYGVDLRRERNLPRKGMVQRPWIKSARPSLLAVEGREGFAEVVQGLDEKTASEEAHRCFHCGSTLPSVIFKPVDRQVPVLPWDSVRALELWQKRQPHEGEALPDIFANITDVTEVPQEIVGRNKLMLKAKNCEELLYYTTDNE
jgi:DMSO reductase iron-sulfur subunit